MFTKLLHGLLLLSVCLSLVAGSASGAQAGRKPIDSGPKSVTTSDLGSGR